MEQTPAEVILVPPGDILSIRDMERVEDAEVEEIQVPDAPAFSLEYQLRDFIASNIETIDLNGMRLKVYIDPTGRDGVEYPSAVGPIDILAVDGKGSFYVFELKRGRTPDYVLGQLARYMGWVKSTIGKGASVKGVIVSKVISENLKYARLVSENIFLYEYEISFSLKMNHDFS